MFSAGSPAIGPVFTKILILRISLILRIFLRIVVFLRKWKIYCYNISGWKKKMDQIEEFPIMTEVLKSLKVINMAVIFCSIQKTII